MKRGRLQTTGWDNESVISVGDFLTGLDWGGVAAHPEKEAHAQQVFEALQAQFEQKSAFLDGSIMFQSRPPLSIHRCVVAACSSVLSDLLSQSPRVSIPANLGLDEAAVDVLISYCYSGSISELGADMLLPVLKAGLALQMGTAVASILDQVRSAFQIGTIIPTLVQAEQLGCSKELTTSCLSFIDERFRDVVLEQSFVDAPVRVVELILARDTLYVQSEIEVFRALSRWNKEDLARRSDDFAALLADPRVVRVGAFTDEDLPELELACQSLAAGPKRDALEAEIARKKKGEATSSSPRTGPANGTFLYNQAGPSSPVLAGRPRLESMVGSRGEQVMFPNVKTLMGHTKGVVALAVYDDSCIISGGADGAICVWDISTMSLKRTVACHADAIVGFKVLPGGLVVSGSLDRTLRIYNPLEEWRTIRIITDAHGEAPVCSMTLINKGAVLATGSAHGEIRLWNVNTWECFQQVPRGHSHVIWAMCEWEGRLVTASSDTTIKIWNTEAAPPQLVHTISGHLDEVQALAVFGNRLLSGADDGVVMVHSAGDFALVESVRLGRPVLALVDLADDFIAAGLGDGTISIMKKKGLTQCAELKGHESSVMALLSWRKKGLISGS